MIVRDRIEFFGWNPSLGRWTLNESTGRVPHEDPLGKLHSPRFFCDLRLKSCKQESGRGQWGLLRGNCSTLIFNIKPALWNRCVCCNIEMRSLRHDPFGPLSCFEWIVGIISFNTREGLPNVHFLHDDMIGLYIIWHTAAHSLRQPQHSKPLPRDSGISSSLYALLLYKVVTIMLVWRSVTTPASERRQTPLDHL